MNIEGLIEEHSQEKLLVYEKYLTAYLSVLANQTHFKYIFIWDILAGKGKDEKGVEGSALIAAKIIKEFRKTKDIRLFLNELDEEKYNRLKNLIYEKGFQEFTEVYKEKANDFLHKVSQALNKADGIHSLFFIDPHGYKQCLPGRLKKLFDLPHSECLIFIPTNHLYRFIKSPKENNPASRLVFDFGVGEDSLKDIKRPDDFVAILENALKKFASTKFVYSYKLQKKGESGGFYHLFFITKHIRGAQKFLEAKNKVKESLTKQLSLFSDKESKLEELLKNFLKNWKTNVEVFEFSIQQGFLPKEVYPVLKSLENAEYLEIDSKDQKRRKGSFYLKAKPEKRIHFKIKI